MSQSECSTLDDHSRLALGENEKQSLFIKHLQEVISEFLNRRSYMNLTSMSRKCSVSEATLRRIMKGHIKTLPTTTTVLDILSFLSGTQNTAEMIKMYPGPIAEFLREMFPFAEQTEVEYDIPLNNALKDRTTYLIYKLASNSNGVKEEKIKDLFGFAGTKILQGLLDAGFLCVEKDSYFTVKKHFTSSHDHFINNFKAVADFIKPNKMKNDSRLNPLFRNFSNSVNANTYREIIQLHKQMLQKVTRLLADEASYGDIPFFMLTAVDTLDEKAAHEFVKD